MDCKHDIFKWEPRMVCVECNKSVSDIEMTRLLRQLQQKQWAPIKTAPKDGTKVLLIGTLFSMSIPAPVPIVGWYSRGWWSYNDVTLYHVTHWMPLPEPPK